MKELSKNVKLQPTQILLLGICLIILVGTIILQLPICNKKPISTIDALFVATTSVCVTGLTPVVIADQFTTFGQVIIMILIQIGGLRINEFFSLIICYNRKKNKFIR